jgi:hypothetical protein
LSFSSLYVVEDYIAKVISILVATSEDGNLLRIHGCNEATTTF